MTSKSIAKRLAVQREDAADLAAVRASRDEPSVPWELLRAGAEPFVCRVNVRTRNPNNGSQGNTVLGRIMRGKAKKLQRAAAQGQLVLAWGRLQRGHRLDLGLGFGFGRGLNVTVTRIAPSNGLDPHDGLGAALKGVIDGTADWLGLKSDRDPRVTWVLDQRRGKRGEYAVEIKIEPRRQS